MLNLHNMSYVLVVRLAVPQKEGFRNRVRRNIHCLHFLRLSSVIVACFRLTQYEPPNGRIIVTISCIRQMSTWMFSIQKAFENASLKHGPQ